MSCAPSKGRKGPYVDVDIGNNVDPTSDGVLKGNNGDYSYKDKCSNQITIRKDLNEPGKGYKKYIHSFGTFTNVSSIHYHGQHQEIIGDSDNYGNEVSVYYLDYDDGNVIPLIFGIKSVLMYKYYQREDRFSSSSKWKKYRLIHDENQLLPELEKICSSTNILVLKLDQYSDEYYANGDPAIAPEANKEARVQVSGPETVDGLYEKYVHRLRTDEKIRLLSTRNEDRYIPFKDPEVYTKEYSEASIYYWNGNESRSHPLLLELKSGDSLTYYKLITENGTKKWQQDSEIQTAKLRYELDKENCEHNRAHVLDISKNVPGLYQCLKNCGTQIKVSHEPPPDQNYLRCSHAITPRSSPSTFSVSRFKNENNEQKGLPPVRNVSRVDTFFYPKDGGKPLLIHYASSGDGDKWYQRDAKTENAWSAVKEGSDKPGSVSEHSKIHKLLVSIYAPEITIKAESSTRYQTDGQSIDVKGPEKVGKESDYYSFTHTREGGPFRIKSITYEESVLPGLTSEDILDSVIFYYEGKVPSLEKPLMVGFVKHCTSSKKYVYYGKPASLEGTWSESNSSSSPLPEDELISRLQGPEKEEIPKVEVSPPQETRVEPETYPEKKEYPDTHKRPAPSISYTGHVVAEEPLASKTEEASSVNVGLIATGIAVGVCLTCLVAYESLMIRRNPTRSVTMRLFSIMNGKRAY